ncbi:hypothetical protein COY90_05150 [Candidatus Roizmanbacteria bacterium CG_4_10_14_0_8_um_filter_39_9]|uniref:Type II secretion system protein GspG C-terminal domain-containing protein n=1 Tax=Candidatus Roizmanbacteria bacterium CG_4_10_14_0_8_um_filter_39_9 TaxID=1974829 RepID=A0A2M7QBI7_9BACT|nr:MAG: hypothetical protein COY90_05150 [Candidatus Roizmanbacteria bacterium CG_4_10_14_0_8_um_filter_39_9]
MHIRRGFTFIEILVVVTIIGIITAVGTLSYSSIMKQSRDAKRKGDLEQIRAAVEMYKSSTNKYPIKLDGIVPTAFCSTTDCSGEVYLSTSPKDPVPATYRYYYYSLDGLSYTIGASLEIQPETGLKCGNCYATGSLLCNYCMGPYGQL